MQNWVYSAVEKIDADFRRSSDTHLLKVDLPAIIKDIDFYLKDESTLPTGSLKHRLARSLFLYGLCNGDIHQDTTIVEASSGSTAISEAYFAQLIGLPFIAVVPKGTSQQKINEISFYGGKCHLVSGMDIYSEASRLAQELNGHYMDQFTCAERVTDWKGNNNIAESIFDQLSMELHPIPTWVVVGAGTGGTSSTIGRYIRYKRFSTKLCVSDPECSVFYDYYHSRDVGLQLEHSSNIEGIGRPRVEPSFIPAVIDRMIKVPDEASFACIRFLERILNRRCGGSTGTNLYASFQIISEMYASGKKGSVVSLICDSGERYLTSYYDDQWLRKNNFDLSPYTAQLEKFYKTGLLKP